MTHLSVSDMTRGFRDGGLSPVDVTEQVLSRIEQADPAVGAYVLVDAQQARAAALASQRRWSAGQPLGPLDGVPVSVKDVLLMRGHPTLRGSATTDPGGRWDEDHPAVARLREGGAVLTGKTTTPELGWKGVTDSPLTGITRNPWDTSRTPGGSSGGASASVALGMPPLALGTDGGGSVRIPASFTGVFAHKPTHGRVPHYPASPFGTLAHVGPISWRVQDAVYLLDAISQPDSRDWSAQPLPAEPLAPLQPRAAGLRIAFSPALGSASVDTLVDTEVAELVARAAAVFAELGAKVEEKDPPVGDPVEDFQVLWFAGAAKSIERLDAGQRARLDPGLVEASEQGERFSAIDYLTATARRMDLGRLMGAFHEDYDLLLTPTMPIPAFRAGAEVPDGWPSPRWTSWTPFTYPFNMTQQPAASVPCGFTAAGLPVGLQVVGPRHADARVLAACLAYEEARPWHDHTPAVSS